MSELKAAASAAGGPTTSVAPGAPATGALPRGGRRDRGGRRLLVWALPLLVYTLVALAGPLAIDYDPVAVRITQRLKPPGTVLQDGTRAWLGTDQTGRDLLAQVIWGARISLAIGVMTIVVAGLLGTTLGLLAGYFGGALDSVLMRLADIQLGFPSILLAILIATVLGPSVANVVITLALTRWVVFARVARATTLTTREREYVTAARAIGAGHLRLLVRHIAPAVVAPFIVIATVEMGAVILAEASLSFLGLGTPPSQPSWGLVIANGRDYLNTAWWISTMPGIALSLVVLAIGSFGDRVRDVLDPRMVQRS